MGEGSAMKVGRDGAKQAGRSRRRACEACVLCGVRRTLSVASTEAPMLSRARMEGSEPLPATL